MNRAALMATNAVTKPAHKPVDEFLLLPFGRVQVDAALDGGPFTFTRRHADQAVNWFRLLGRKLVIDYEHQTLGDRYNTRADQIAPAAGWIGRLVSRRDGLWACNIEWTRKARELIAGGEYRYFSPVVYWAGRYGDDVGALGAVALTNNPALRCVPTLAASQERRPSMYTVGVGRPVPLMTDSTTALKLDPERSQKGEPAMIEQIAEALGLEPESGIELILEAIAALQAKLEEQAGGAVAASRTGRVTASPVERPAVIVAARRRYATESADPGTRMITSERNAVNLALRDARQQRLTEREIAEYGISEEL